MKRYVIDVNALENVDKEKVYDTLHNWVFMAIRHPKIGPLETIEVLWDREDDFLASPIFPTGCPCVQIG